MLTCPSQSETRHTMRGEVKPGWQEDMGGGGASGMHGEGPTEGGAHPEHGAHVRDLGRVEAQRLVERRRVLPRVERRAYGAGRGCGPADGGDGVLRAVEARLQIGGRACVERTWNMDCMVVTLEASKLSGWLNTDAYCRESKGGHAVRGKVRAGWREAAGDRVARSACTGEGSTADWGQATGRSARGAWIPCS